MAMILAGGARPEQIGAFLMLLRVKEETGDEIAGFVRAVRATLPKPAIRADLDWPSYAGKRRRLPWFLLAALTLADAGWRVAMHGLEGHTAGRLYAREAIARLGLPIAGGFDEAAAQSRSAQFRLSAAGRLLPAARRAVRLARDPRPALAGPHAGAARQSVRRAGFDPVGVPSRLHGDPPRRRAAARRSAHDGVPRRRRRSGAAAQQAVRNAHRRGRRGRRNALAAAARRPARRLPTKTSISTASPRCGAARRKTNTRPPRSSAPWRSRWRRSASSAIPPRPGRGPRRCGARAIALASPRRPEPMRESKRRG